MVGELTGPPYTDRYAFLPHADGELSSDDVIVFGLSILAVDFRISTMVLANAAHQLLLRPPTSPRSAPTVACCSARPRNCSAS
ncbi:hypothetical protein GKJPGBOP_01565 [Streptomyces paromomycinus]|uniref:Uncharacterized protein n=1 Tax=Streptomyces paromomycinus TaxID=92743 RepID=A0A401VXW5_STREY|nr:hypothetical protein GKJPGBOP_01565 [Streptomyces paromomycinus]